MASAFPGVRLLILRWIDDLKVELRLVLGALTHLPWVMCPVYVHKNEQLQEEYWACWELGSNQAKELEVGSILYVPWHRGSIWHIGKNDDGKRSSWKLQRGEEAQGKSWMSTETEKLMYQLVIKDKMSARHGGFNWLPGFQKDAPLQPLANVGGG